MFYRSSFGRLVLILGGFFLVAGLTYPGVPLWLTVDCCSAPLALVMTGDTLLELSRPQAGSAFWVAAAVTYLALFTLAGWSRTFAERIGIDNLGMGVNAPNLAHALQR